MSSFTRNPHPQKKSHLRSCFYTTRLWFLLFAVLTFVEKANICLGQLANTLPIRGGSVSHSLTLTLLVQKGEGTDPFVFNILAIIVR